MFFKKRATVDDVQMQWQLECWELLDAISGAVDDPPGRKLVVRSSTNFPATNKTGHAKASHYFDLVREHIDMREWPCELVAQDPRPELGQSIVFGSQKSGGACGTFQMRGNRARITYDPKMLDDPIGLIATFAHELCHYVLAGVTDPPGGSETIEPLTDLATVHLGFGLFGANTAFNFQQSTSYDRQGWSYSRAGYLSEAEWSFANAVFFEMRGAAPASYEPYAKSSVLSGIAKNRTFLKQNPKFIASLKSPHSHLRLV